MKWFLFNDLKVDEFKIDNEDEKFEENFKSENTPYIVIYKKKRWLMLIMHQIIKKYIKIMN